MEYTKVSDAAFISAMEIGSVIGIKKLAAVDSVSEDVTESVSDPKNPALLDTESVIVTASVSVPVNPAEAA
jgi:hypothetical protein